MSRLTMDPNEALAAIVRLCTGDAPLWHFEDFEALLEYAGALRDWLATGGYEPDWHAHEHGHLWYRLALADLERVEAGASVRREVAR